MRRISFLSLPTEVQCLVKDAISPSDLRTHVCFYLSNPSCAALYDSLHDADGFWQHLCWSCGIGMLPAEDLDRVPWREIAIKCIQLDGFCTHPQCGDPSAEAPPLAGELMRESAEYMTPGEVILVDQHFRHSYKELRLGAHMVFSHISFRDDVGLRAFPVNEEAYVRFDEEGAPSPITENSSRAYLGQHPLVSHSFATAAPVYNMYIFGFCDTDLYPDCGDVQSRAVTVYDVLNRLHG
ncbi:hypothetical protein C8T65DRAFT_607362, partial [Cerioporus squamosus]